MSVPLPDHDHCKFCGDAVPFDMAFCSEKCYYAEQKRLKKEKMTYVILGIGAIVAIAVASAIRLMS